MAANNNSGEILMLEAPPEKPAGPTWRVPANAEIVDALPYIDDDYANPAVKREVDRLVEEEMRRSSKKPSDFLKDLPPPPKSDFQVSAREILLLLSRVFVFGWWTVWLLRK